MVSVFGWPDPNMRKVARVEKSARNTSQRRVILRAFLDSRKLQCEIFSSLQGSEQIIFFVNNQANQR